MAIAEGRQARPPASVWICDGLAVLAAGWTLCCHAVVASNGSMRDLMWVAAIAAGIGLAFAAYALRHGWPSASAPAVVAQPAFGSFPLAARLAGAAMAAVAVYGLVTRGAVALWWGAVATIAIGAIAACWRTPQPTAPGPPQSGVSTEALLWTMGALCALVPLAFHRSDLDTAFYVSIATAAVDQLDAPLMLDSIHGVAGLGLHQPAHRVHSFELWNAVVSLVAGKPPLYAYLVITAAAAAFLVPLAHARLFRILTPGYWPWSVAALLAVVLGGGGTLWWYGNFSLVRIFHGKSVYLSVFLPLIYAYGLRFGGAPSRRRWLRLFAAQIAALGCTSSALWSAPIAAGLGVLCAVRWDRRAMATLALGALSSVYLVGVGLSLVGDMSRAAALVTPDTVTGEALADALAKTFGRRALCWFAVASSIAGWVLLRPGLAQRFAIVVPFAVFGLVLCPYWAESVGRHLTGPSYWRTLWSLPAPILMALALMSPLQLASAPARGVRRGLAWGSGVAAIWAFVSFVPAYSAISPENRVMLGGFPRLKVPLPYFEVAFHLAKQAPEGSMVVAPQKVAIWVIAIPGHPSVSFARDVYLQRIAAEAGEEAADLRMALSQIVSRPSSDFERRIRRSEAFRRLAEDPDPMRRFEEGLERLSVRGVCLNRAARLAQSVREALERRGFEQREVLLGYEIWVLDAD